MRSHVVFCAVLLCGLVLGACSDDDDDDDRGATGGQGGTGATGDGGSGGKAGSGGTAGNTGGSSGVAGAAGSAALSVRLMEVIATDQGFNPSHWLAAPGEDLIVQLRNEGTAPHDISFELADETEALDAPVMPQMNGTLTFSAPSAPGDYTFFSTVEGDRAMGLEGTLTVRAQPEVTLTTIAEGLTSPVTMVMAPDDTGRQFIVDQAGQIRIVTADGMLLEQPFLDVSDKLVALEPMYDERGLLGLAFHPDYAQNGRLFVYYSAPLRAGAPEGWNCTSVISEFTVSASDADMVDPASERMLLQIDKPQSNHNGGTLAFGPDGFLYISIGDGGGANDTDMGHTPDLGNGQDLTDLLGNILRIDVDSGDPYAVPPTNPFAAGGGSPEIFAYGLRNPYRFSFDMGGSQALFVGDAGQNLWEEVSMVELGGNYGWHVLEGTHCFDPMMPDVSLPTCADTGASGEPLIWPIIEYANSEQMGGLGLTVVGGYVYRGSKLAELAGRYVFGSYSQDEMAPEGLLMVADDLAGGGDLWPLERIRVTNTADGTIGKYLKGFGQDADGEIYVLTSDEAGPTGTTGMMQRLE